MAINDPFSKDTALDPSNLSPVSTEKDYSGLLGKESMAPAYTGGSAGLTPAQQAQYNKTFAMFANQPSVNTPIGVSDLSSTSNAPIIPVVPPPSVNTRGLATANDTSTSNIETTSSYTPPATDPKAKLNEALSAITGNIANQGTQIEQINKDAGLVEAKKVATGFKNQLTRIDKDYQDLTNEIKLNKEGKFAGAIQQDLTKAYDDYQNRRANVSINYNTAIGDYQAALDTVNLKVSALKDSNNQSLQLYGLLKDSVYNDMTESEKFQAENIQKEKESKARAKESAYATVMDNLAKNNAPASAYALVDQAAQDPNSSVADVYAAGSRYSGTGGGISSVEVSDNLSAYASQFATTGTLPSASDLKAAGLTVGQVTLAAKQQPKANGQVVNRTTGVVDSKIPAAEREDYSRLYNIVNNTKKLKELDKERIGGVIAGTLGKVFGSDKQAEYIALRKTIIDDISRMQSGAALTKDEVDFYKDYLPGRLSNSFFLGQGSEKVIGNFESAMENKLKDKLDTNGLSIYGYSKVKVGGEERTVGEVLEIGGEQYRVLPDGSLTDII